MKQQGGILEQILREVEIECLPGDIPARSKPTSASWCSARCCAFPICRTTTSSSSSPIANQPVAHVITVKEEVVATPEAVAAEAAATPAEPEVIKKGKQEVGEEGAEPAAEKAEKPEKKEKK